LVSLRVGAKPWSAKELGAWVSQRVRGHKAMVSQRVRRKAMVSQRVRRKAMVSQRVRHKAMSSQRFRRKAMVSLRIRRKAIRSHIELCARPRDQP
jgi:hypothetical protein